MMVEGGDHGMFAFIVLNLQRNLPGSKERGIMFRKIIEGFDGVESAFFL